MARRWIALGLIAVALACIALWVGSILGSRGSAARVEEGPFAQHAAARSVRRIQPRVEPDAQSGADPDVSRRPVGQAAPAPLELQIVSENGAPIADAEVSAFDSSDVRIEQVRSDAAGRCGLNPVRAVAEIAVRRDGFATLVAAPESLPSSDGAKCARLTAAGVIRGRVRRPSGAAPSSSLLVSAWPTETLWVTARDARRAEARDPRLLTARTDASGAFEIAGCPRDADMRLIAGGAGMAQTKIWVIARAGAPDSVELEVVPLFVLDVVLVDSRTGEPVRALDTHGLGGLVETPVRAQTTGQFTPTSPGVAWAGIRLPSDVTSDGRVFRICGVDTDAEEFGPIPVKVSLPGYEDLRADIPAHRARADAPTPAYELALVRTSAGFGAIEVSLGDAPEPVRRGLTTAHALAMYAELRSVPPGVSVRVGLPGIGRQPVTVSNVPEGRYQTWIRIPLGLQSACSKVQEILVHRDRSTMVVWDLPDAAAIELRPRTADGAEFSGPLSVLIRRRGSTRGGSWALTSPPYVIAGFDAGPYDVNATNFAFGVTSKWIPADAAAGQATQVDLTLERPR